METTTEAGRDVTESLKLAFEISNILETGLDYYTLSLLIALCDRGLNPEALAALVRELSPHRSDPVPAASSRPNPHKP